MEPMYPVDGQQLWVLQQDVERWHELAWGDKTLDRLGCKLGEEAGEVLGQIIRSGENRPGGSVAEIADELADTLIVLCAIAAKIGVDLDSIVKDRFYGDVQYRQDPVHGMVPWATQLSALQQRSDRCD